MRNQWKRNAVVATVLLFVCAAVYLNWRYAGNLTDDTQPVSQQQPEENSNTKVLGDAALVGGVPTAIGEDTDASAPASAPGSYFDTARLSRQQSRDNALSILREAAAQENVEQTVLDDANRAIQTLADYSMLEGQIENLVVAKGYADCVAFIGEDALSLAVSAPAGGLTEADTAKIMDVVKQVAGFTADQLTIIEVE